MTEAANEQAEPRKPTVRGRSWSRLPVAARDVEVAGAVSCVVLELGPDQAKLVRDSLKEAIATMDEGGEEVIEMRSCARIHVDRKQALDLLAVLEAAAL